MAKMSYVGKLSLFFGISWGLEGLDRLIVGYTAPGYMPALNLNFTQLGILLTIAGICTAIGAWVINPLTEYYGRKIGSVWVNLINTVISGITGLVRSFGQMLGIRALVALGFGGMYGPGFAAISEESPPEKRGFYMGLTQSFSAIHRYGNRADRSGLSLRVGGLAFCILSDNDSRCDHHIVYGFIHARTGFSCKEH